MEPPETQTTDPHPVADPTVMGSTSLVRPELQQGPVRGWLFLVLNSPLIGYWLCIAALVITILVRWFDHPKEALALITNLTLLCALTRLAARTKGVSAWPPPLRRTPRDHD
jgi:hypothetical protein